MITARFVRETAERDNKCDTCDRAFRDAAELQRFMSKQVCT